MEDLKSWMVISAGLSYICVFYFVVMVYYICLVIRYGGTDNTELVWTIVCILLYQLENKTDMRDAY